MYNLIKFEFKKFFSKKKNLLSIFIFIIITTIFSILNIQLDSNYNRNKSSMIAFSIESIENALLKLNSESEKNENSKIEQIKKSYETELLLLNKQYNAIVSDNQIEELEYQIQLDNLLLTNIKNNMVITEISENELQDRINLNNILLDNNITPINTNWNMSSLNFFKIFLNGNSMLIIIILIIILTSDIVSSESENKTFYLLLTQPISKTKVILSKIISSILILLSTIGSILLIISLFLGFSQGFGDLNYPVKIVINDNIEYIKLGKYLIYLISNFITLIIFITILSIFISTLCKQSLSSFSLTIIITISNYIIVNNGMLNNLAHLIPFTYINLSSVLQGDLIKIYNNNSINSVNMTYVLIFYSLILFVMSLFIFNKRKNYC